MSNFLKHSDKKKKYPKHCSSAAHLSYYSINILLLTFLVKRLQENQVHSVKLLFDQGNILSIKEKKIRQGKGKKYRNRKNVRFSEDQRKLIWTGKMFSP